MAALYKPFFFAPVLSREFFWERSDGVMEWWSGGVMQKTNTPTLQHSAGFFEGMME
jgi:hypothetical protein